MEFKNILDSKISVLGIGTAGIGGWDKKDFSKDNDYIKIIKSAIQLGITHIDTAELYGIGHTEEIIGKAMANLPRSKLFITSKVWQTNLKYNDVLKSAENSLKRLGVKYLDLYLIHHPNPRIPLKETVEALDLLVDQKKVKFIGVSNFSVSQLRQAQKFSKHKIVANQVEYNLLKRWPEKELLQYCKANDILIIAYQPLAAGRIVKKKFNILDELSKKYNKTPSQIAINWLISKPNIVTIPKSTNISHIKENLGAIGWEIQAKDTKRLEKYFYTRGIIYDIISKVSSLIKIFLTNNLSPNQKKKIKLIYWRITKKR